MHAVLAVCMQQRQRQLRGCTECGKALGSLEGNLPLGTSKSSVRQTVDQQLRGLIRKVPPHLLGALCLI